MNLRGITDFIERNESFILTAHETPDADALGAEVALFRLLRQIGKRVLILNADPSPIIFQFIHEGCDLIVVSSPDDLPDELHSYALIILDVNDTRNIGSIADLVVPHCREYFILDHHEREGTIIAENIIVEDASSTCELLYELIVELGGEIDLTMAVALYSGIVYDTGSFVYPKTSARTLDIGRHLVEIGVTPNQIYSRMYESNSISSIMLQSRVLATLELYLENHVAVQSMSAQTLLSTGASYEEGQTLINVPLRSRDILVSVFFKENLESVLRCSLRSKGEINVAEIAQTFGGGGHKTAAGFKCKSGIDDALQVILEKLRPAIG